MEAVKETKFGTKAA